MSTMEDEVSCKDSAMGISSVHANVDVQDLYKDVLTMKRNLQNDVAAESPKEAFALAKAFRSFSKFKNATEKQLERREMTAFLREVRADHREVRADHRDVRADHRDVLAEQTKQTLVESKRQLDLCFDRYLEFMASTTNADESEAEEDGPESEAEEDEPESKSEAEEDEPESKSVAEEDEPEPKSEAEEDEPESKADDDEPKPKSNSEESKPNSKPKSNSEEDKPKSGFAAAIKQKLDSAESAIKLGEKAVELGEKAAEVTTRVEKLGEAVNKSKTVKFLLSAVISSASMYARRALQEWKDGDDSDAGSDLG